MTVLIPAPPSQQCVAVKDGVRCTHWIGWRLKGMPDKRFCTQCTQTIAMLLTSDWSDMWAIAEELPEEAA